VPDASAGPAVGAGPRVKPVKSFSKVGVGESEGRWQALGGDAADAASLGALDGFVGVVFGVAGG
jgi:hypothetical protein